MAFFFRNLLTLSASLLLFISPLACLRAALVPYVQPGKTDFDTVMQTLNPYGTWAQIKGTWAYTPLDHHAPYTSGRWIYTDYGWCWRGNTPTSWATEHYGYWKLGPDRVWSWYPGGTWYPEIVEIRESGNAVGWRPSQVNASGDFTESDAERYARPEEWCFVTQQEFAGLLTPAIVSAHAAEAAQLLEASTDSRHTYYTYRELDRVGPHPILFKKLAVDGTMFPPHTLADDLAVQPPAPLPAIPGLPTQTVKLVHESTEVTPTPPAKKTGDDPNDPARKVKYWVIMCLPTFWTAPPAEAKETETYFYRPDMYQDEDGIQRRVFLWLNPRSRVAATQQLNQALNGSYHTPALTNLAPAVPAQPAVYQNPLNSPFSPINPPRPSSPSASSKTSAQPISVPPPLFPHPVTNTAPRTPPPP